jgi:hypothetical protein
LRFLPCVVVESSSVTDNASSNAALATLVSESLVASDQLPSVSAIFGSAISESLNAADALGPGRILVILMAESLGATDRINAYGLWNFIEDAEDPNWQNINNS